VVLEEYVSVRRSLLSRRSADAAGYLVERSVASSAEWTRQRRNDDLREVFKSALLGPERETRPMKDGPLDDARGGP
jgi:hypothetical protein